MLALAAIAALVAVHSSRPVARAGPLPPPTQALSLLGDTLVAPPLPDSTRARYERLLAQAQNDYDHDPSEVTNIIWLGRRAAYLGRFLDAIAIYTRGIAIHHDDPRLYRHRGHRYITIRAFELARGDLEIAAALMRKRTDSVEPDGLPNARNIPTTTLKFNIWYHLGLAYYLQGDYAAARDAYRQCLAVSNNPDMLCATTHWFYLTLRRLGREGDARKLLKPIRRDLNVIENRGYLRLLLMYKGELPLDSLRVGGGATPVDNATIGYGVGAWLLLNGRMAEATANFQRIVAAPEWPAFGHIAAEAELKRMGAAKE